jgi:hypothetical protein
MDLAKSRVIRYVFVNGWGAEEFRKNLPVPHPERTILRFRASSYNCSIMFLIANGAEQSRFTAP